MATLSVRDPSLIVLVGPAGSGKSTLARRLFAADEILSSDALRAVVAGDEADQAASRTAFSILHRELARRLAAGKLTVVDATNLRREHRRPLLARAHQAGVPAVAVVLDLPVDVVRAQNAGRARVVDAEVVDRHLAWLRRSVDDGQLAAEGFAPVIVLRTPDEVAGLRIDRVPPIPVPLSRAP
jgi:protein phosphatase